MLKKIHSFSFILGVHDDKKIDIGKLQTIKWELCILKVNYFFLAINTHSLEYLNNYIFLVLQSSTFEKMQI